MFGIGLFEITVILIVGLLFIGPSRLPEVARQAGKFFVKMRRITNDMRQSVDTFVQQAESEVFAEERQKLEALIRENIAEVPASEHESTHEENDNPPNAETFDPHTSLSHEEELNPSEQKKDAD